MIILNQSSCSAFEFQFDDKQRSTGEPLPELCTQGVFQSHIISSFDKNPTR